MNPTELQAHVFQFFVEQADLTSDDLVVLGVSGGVDSMTDADVSVRVAQETGIRFLVSPIFLGAVLCLVMVMKKKTSPGSVRVKNLKKEE